MNNFIILSILISIFSFLLYNYIESRRQFVFGYGSLIIDESREKTLHHPSTGYKAYLSSTFNHKRSWTLIKPNYNIELVMKYSFNQKYNTSGIIFQIDPESLEKIDRRESNYQRIQIPVHMIQSDELKLHSNNKIWIYVRNNEKIIPIVYSSSDQIDYINRLLNACRNYGKDYMKNFIHTTSGWNLNWLEHRSIHESLLRYKKYTITE